MKKYITDFVLVLMAIIFMYPVVLTLVNSFTAQPQILDIKSRTDIWPDGFHISGYYSLLLENQWFLRGFWNSIFYAIVITGLNIMVSVPAAYAFKEARFRGKYHLYFFYIILMMMPLQVTILPNYIGLRDMNLLDTPWALILPGIFAPFGVFLMCQYMRGLDRSTIDAIRLETKSIFQILRYVAIPQVKTCIFALFLFTFAENWNLVEQPNVYLKNMSLMPLSVLLAVNQQLNVLTLFAGSVIFMVPIILLYGYFHESLELGLENIKI